jgi:hypothetical protein
VILFAIYAETEAAVCMNPLKNSGFDALEDAKKKVRGGGENLR